MHFLAEKVDVENNRKNKKKRDRWTAEWYGARESADTLQTLFEFGAKTFTMSWPTYHRALM